MKTLASLERRGIGSAGSRGRRESGEGGVNLLVTVLGVILLGAAVWWAWGRADDGGIAAGASRPDASYQDERGIEESKERTTRNFNRTVRVASSERRPAGVDELEALMRSYRKLLAELAPFMEDQDDGTVSESACVDFKAILDNTVLPESLDDDIDVLLQAAYSDLQSAATSCSSLPDRDLYLFNSLVNLGLASYLLEKRYGEKNDGMVDGWIKGRQLALRTTERESSDQDSKQPFAIRQAKAGWRRELPLRARRYEGQRLDRDRRRPRRIRSPL